jgi:DNA processing protein
MPAENPGIASEPGDASPGDPYNYGDPDLPYWLALNRVHGIGPARFHLLLDRFGSAEHVWHGEPDDWLAAGLDPLTTASFTEERRHIVPEVELEALLRHQVGVLRSIDLDYPPLLKEIHLPPPVLYLRGRLLPADNLALAIVGTRRATTYGRQVTQQITTELARRRFTIVSGLARGVDTCAHAAALAAGGRTVAVLGSGPDIIYPPENARLLERIVENGAAITPFAPGTPPEAGNFPARNRLISGLSLGVVVMEAPRQSGALITARFAGEQGRDVFAVPASIYNKSSFGALQLIQDGAKLVIEVRDILDELNFSMVPRSGPAERSVAENETEARLLALLGAGEGVKHVDDLCHLSGLPIATVTATLTWLELRGQVALVAPQTYILMQFS